MQLCLLKPRPKSVRVCCWKKEFGLGEVYVFPLTSGRLLRLGGCFGQKIAYVLSLWLAKPLFIFGVLIGAVEACF